MGRKGQAVVGSEACNLARGWRTAMGHLRRVDTTASMSARPQKAAVLLRYHALALRPSRPGEFHPEPLTEPYVNLSIHTARVIA